MPLLSEFIEKPEYMHCIVSGSYDNVWEAVSGFRQIILRCRCSELSNVMYDSRNMTGYPGATERIIYMSKIIDQHDMYLSFGGAPLRIAFLGRSDILRSYSPGLDVAARRGFAAINTSSMEEATSWLLDSSIKSNRIRQEDSDSLNYGLTTPITT